jgi:hypothetical protein
MGASLKKRGWPPATPPPLYRPSAPSSNPTVDSSALQPLVWKQATAWPGPRNDRPWWILPGGAASHSIQPVPCNTDSQSFLCSESERSAGLWIDGQLRASASRFLSRRQPSSLKADSTRRLLRNDRLTATAHPIEIFGISYPGRRRCAPAHTQHFGADLRICLRNREAGSQPHIRPLASRKKILRSRASSCGYDGPGVRSLRMTRRVHRNHQGFSTPSEEGARVIFPPTPEQERRPKNLVGQRCSLSSAGFSRGRS